MKIYNIMKSLILFSFCFTSFSSAENWMTHQEADVRFSQNAGVGPQTIVEYKNKKIVFEEASLLKIVSLKMNKESIVFYSTYYRRYHDVSLFIIDSNKTYDLFDCKVKKIRYLDSKSESSRSFPVIIPYYTKKLSYFGLILPYDVKTYETPIPNQVTILGDDGIEADENLDSIVVCRFSKNTDLLTYKQWLSIKPELLDESDAIIDLPNVQLPDRTKKHRVLWFRINGKNEATLMKHRDPIVRPLKKPRESNSLKPKQGIDPIVKTKTDTTEETASSSKPLLLWLLGAGVLLIGFIAVKANRT